MLPWGDLSAGFGVSEIGQGYWTYSIRHWARNDSAVRCSGIYGSNFGKNSDAIPDST